MRMFNEMFASGGWSKTLVVHNKGGWTIVEIITTLVIISITGMFAAPEVMNWRDNMRVTGVARDIYANLNEAKIAAVEKNANVIVMVDKNANNYEIFVDNGGTTGTANNRTQDGDEEILASIQLNSGNYVGTFLHNITIAGNVGFTPRARSFGGNTGEIVLRNGKSDRWYKVELERTGSLGLLKSIDSTDGVNGTWN